jgi:hypothetical protein
MYLQDFLNMKYADCNGDSTLNNLDLGPINMNYGMRHNTHNNLSGMPEATTMDPVMSLSVPSFGYAGATITVPIMLGTISKPIASLYGYSFTVNYDPSQVVAGSVSVNLSSNWLASTANELTITKDNYTAGRIDAAVVRWDKTETLNGYGQIGVLTLTLKSTATGTLDLSLAGSSKMLTTRMYSGGPSSSGPTEIFRPMNLVGGTVSISTGIDENALNNTVSVYPNPANDLINVTVSREISSMTLYNSIGQMVWTSATAFANSTVIDVNKLAEGIYTLSCKSSEGTVIKKISIVR